MAILYNSLRSLLKLSLELYYVEIQQTGSEHVPKTGPVVFAANHPNSIMDTVVLGSQTSRNVSYLARSGLFKNPLVAAVFNRCGVIPLYRRQDGPMESGSNDGAFGAAFDVLDEGGTIGIFPEGRNAPERHVRDIKTGTARIALGAEARRDFELGVTVIPVGLNFLDRDQFLTRVLVRFGEPIDTREYKDTYEEDPRQAVRDLTQRLQDGIRKEAVHVHDVTHHELVQDIQDIYGRTLQDEVLGKIDVRSLDSKLLSLLTGRETSHRDLDAEFQVKQWIADAVSWFEEKSPSRVEELRRRIRDYKDSLRQTQLRINFSKRSPETISSRREGVKMTLYAIVFAPVALWGLAHNFIPYRLGRRFALKAPDEAMRAIRALGIGGVLFGLFYSLYFMSAYHGSGSAWVAAAYIVTLPLAGFWFLRYRRQLARYADKILLRNLFRTRSSALRQAVANRKLLIEEFEDLRVEFKEESGFSVQ